MPKVVAEDSFGRRVKPLIKHRGWSIATFAKMMGETKATLYPLLRQSGWPERGPKFYARVAEVLQCTIAELMPDDVAATLRPEGTGVDALMESRQPFEFNRERDAWVQPMTDRTIAVRALGRLEHYAQRIQQLSDEYTKKIAAIGQMAADDVTEARRALMKKIDTNDKGEKI